jgi:transposase
LKTLSSQFARRGRRIWRGICPSDLKLVAEVIRKHAPEATRVVFETGPLSIWYYHELTAAGLPAICIDARQAKKGLDMTRNKTDANNADGLAHLAEAAFYKEVRVKGYDSMLVRTLVDRFRRMVPAPTADICHLWRTPRDSFVAI